MPRTRFLPAILAIGLVLSACSGTTTTSPEPTPDLTPKPTESPTEQPTAEPTEAPTSDPTPTATPSPVMSGPPGGFAILPNADADALFLDRDTCMNERDGYQVDFPDDWWTNTEFGNGRYPACIWFSPTFYRVTDLNVVPDEIAITITWHATDIGRHDADIVTREEVIVGGQLANRVEWDDDTYWYAIQLGPTPEEGPNLLVETSTQRGGEYELNKAVMDRMMATIEFFGSTQ
jgi:hypothetical protein